MSNEDESSFFQTELHTDGFLTHTGHQPVITIRHSNERYKFTAQSKVNYISIYTEKSP